MCKQKHYQVPACSWLVFVEFFHLIPMKGFTQWKMNEAREVSLFCQCHGLDSVLLDLSGIMLNKSGLQKANPLIYWKHTGLCVGVVNSMAGMNVNSHHWDMLTICNATINRDIDISVCSAGCCHLIASLTSEKHIMHCTYFIMWAAFLYEIATLRWTAYSWVALSTEGWMHCKKVCYINRSFFLWNGRQIALSSLPISQLANRDKHKSAKL